LQENIQGKLIGVFCGGNCLLFSMCAHSLESPLLALSGILDHSFRQSHHSLLAPHSIRQLSFIQGLFLPSYTIYLTDFFFNTCCFSLLPKQQKVNLQLTR
jgi:hypothetical protein